ncbi:MFS transporter [Streptomyces indicus]|uniref:Major Facilitator Superfamily protein n=1 Tax=Streptomyces indicus TaxID=417292 RepID=A0A1G8TFJ9_9ACTN|nr:MFS transporter [Streptomyces indicus]SDJ39460.1 Major Facilitator Superfamily protein [Streptomyces indicus]
MSPAGTSSPSPESLAPRLSAAAPSHESPREPSPGPSPFGPRPAGGGLGRLLTLLALGHTAMFMVYMGVGQVLLPVQIEALDPADKVANLGLVSGISAVFATLFNPLAGLLSDRSRRRNPWILGGGIAALGALALLGAMRTLLLVTIGWCLVQAMMNVYQAAITAVVPDRVPTERRGLASAMVGIGTPLGVIAGVTLAASFVPGSVTTGYLALGAVIALAAVLFTALVREQKLPAVESVPLARQFAAFGAALKAPDFRWAFIGRFLMMLGYFSVALFQLYIVQDHISLPAGLEPAEAVAILSPVNALCMLLATVVGGVFSDRIGRRKPFIAVSCVLTAVGMAAPVLSSTWTGMLVFAAVTGLSFGCFMAVDTALVTLVLPSADDAARDMGVLNIANAGPQIIGPFLASVVVAQLGGYTGLFVTGAVITILGALSVVPIRGVR